MSAPCQYLNLCPATQVPLGEVIRIDQGSLSLAVFNLDGEILVTDDACTHGPGSLSEGFVEGEVVECNFHGGSFNIRTGEVVAPPCMTPLKTYRARVDQQGMVSIEV